MVHQTFIQEKTAHHDKQHRKVRFIEGSERWCKTLIPTLTVKPLQYRSDTPITHHFSHSLCCKPTRLHAQVLLVNFSVYINQYIHV